MDVIESRYNLKEEIDKIEKIIRLHINDKSIDFRVNVSEDLPDHLYGNGNKVKQIMMNLLTNAVKYTESGHVYLTLDCEKERNNAKITISVTDTGIGIEESQLDNLFNKFSRLDSVKDSDISGTGLGLAITKSLVDMLDGKIEVDSTYGKGSTFTVSLHQRVVD